MKLLYKVRTETRFSKLFCFFKFSKRVPNLYRYATAMKDLGKTLGFTSRFIPVLPNHIAANLFAQPMPWDAGAEAGRWLAKAAEVHSEVGGCTS